MFARSPRASLRVCPGLRFELPFSNFRRGSGPVHEAVAALARHIVIRAPDKAEFRALAADAGVDLVQHLPLQAQHEFAVFLTRLSHTPKVSCLMLPCHWPLPHCHFVSWSCLVWNWTGPTWNCTAQVSQRTMAVELAPRLLKALPNAYSPAPIALPLLRTPAGALVRRIRTQNYTLLRAVDLTCVQISGSMNRFSLTMQQMGRRGSTVPSTGSSGGWSPAQGASTAALLAHLAAAGTESGDASPAPSCAGWTTPQVMRPSPPGTACLAVLVQRCSDKSAAVRARAIANLAVAVSGHLSTDGNHEFRRVCQLND